MESNITIKKIYLAGPMRGIKDFNFPAFHEGARILRAYGFEVFSAAEYEEAIFGKGFNKSETGDLKDIAHLDWDFREAFAKDCHYISIEADAVVCLPGWEKSKGACAEVAIAKALGLKVVDICEFPDPLAKSNPIALPGGETRIVDRRTGGAKGQKLARFDLIPSKALWELAEIYGRGAKKYADDNWRKGYSWKLSIGALERHLHQWKQGHKRDEDGNHHIMQVAWHCITLFTFELLGLGTDDRYKENLEQAIAEAPCKASVDSREPCAICGKLDHYSEFHY